MEQGASGSMEQRTNESANGLQGMVEAYLDALQRQDLEGCVNFFSDDASIHFLGGEFRGSEAIRAWHRDRFIANLEILKTSNFKTEENTVTLDALVTSDKIKAWKIGKLAGKVAISVKDGRIAEIKLSPKVYNPLSRK
ncbi:MAG: nuclear transport factor 2 family protein [Chloroflexota bacterium]